MTASGKINSGRSLPGTASGFELQYPAHATPPSEENEHIPFVFWMIEAFRPRVVVELGVNTGNIYCALLQAIKALDLDAMCFGLCARDGSKTDAFQTLETYHNVSYAKFSTLTRGNNLEEAPRSFADGSIDLLHLNGSGLDDTVFQHFDVWLKKISSRGILLVFGTRAPEQRGCAQSFWKGLSSRYPSFEFTHGSGLGAAYLGNEALSDGLDTLFRMLVPLEAARTRDYFARLGTSVRDRALLDASHRNFAQSKLDQELLYRLLKQQTMMVARAQRESAFLRQGQLSQLLLRYVPGGLKRLMPMKLKLFIVQRMLKLK